MTDPLASTLMVLPLVLIGIWATERWIRRHEATTSGPLATFEAAVLVLLVLAVLGRESLGLSAGSPGLDQVLAAGLFLLLAMRLGSLVTALSRRSGDDPASRPPWPYLVLPMLLYIAILPWSASQREPDGDEPYYLLIAHSLAWDLDTDLANNYADHDSLTFMSRALEPSWADPEPRAGKVYSRHSPLFPAVLVPGYRLGGRWGAMLTMVAIAAAVAYLSLVLFLRYWGREHQSAAVVVWALLSLTPPLLLYSHQIWIELPSALVVIGALLLIQDLRQRRGAPMSRWALLVILLVFLPLLKLRFAVLSASLLALAWWRSGRSKRTLLLTGLGLLVAVGSILVYNSVVFDNPFKDHTLDQLIGIQASSPFDYLRGVAGLFWDCAFGLTASNPLWLLLAPALVLSACSRPPALFDLLVCAVPYLALVAPREEWFGAWSPPFRFGLVLLPLAALLLVPLWERRVAVGAKATIIVLGLLALVLSSLWIAVPGWTYNLAVGTNHLIDHLSVRLAADVGRWFPSMVRPRMASWWFPILSGSAAILFWWLPRRRPVRMEAWAATFLLLLGAALPVLAVRVPTRWVELEDRQVIKRGGVLYPDAWVPYRPRFRGGWSLASGESVQVPVTAGSTVATLTVELSLQGKVSAGPVLRVLAGDRLVSRLDIEPRRGWQILKLERVEWSAGTDLVLELEESGSDSDATRVILDRLHFGWS